MKRDDVKRGISAILMLCMLFVTIPIALAVEVEDAGTGQSESVIGTPFRMIKGMVDWLKAYWGYILFSLVLLILGIVIYYLFAKMEDERKERDDVAYEEYKNTDRDCDLQSDMRKIRKTWNPLSLFWLLFPPLCWLIFVMKREHSNKVINAYNEIIGYYRGHCQRQDGTINFKVYKEKFLIFFEKPFILKCPVQLTLKEKDKKSDKDVSTTVKLPEILQMLPNGDIKISCVSVEKLGYYRIPVYVDKEGKIVDFRSQLGAKLTDSGYNLMLKRVLATGSQMVERAMQHNPHLIYEQRSPQKTKEEERQEET